MAKVETKTVVAVAECGTEVKLEIPAVLGPEPSERAKATMNLKQDPKNWKYPIDAYHTLDEEEALELAACYDWYCGGHELSHIETEWGKLYEVSSKGYYHYCGA